MNNIAQLVEKFKSLELSNNIDFDKFNQYAIVHHSSTIEGSTLTEIETRLLLDEGTTPAGKPLVHSLMVKDHYEALLFVLKSAEQKQAISSSFIQSISAAVMKNTGSIYQTVFGELDASKGEYRKGNVSAGNSYFVGYDKVPDLVNKLCRKIEEQYMQASTIEAQLDISFDAHFDLVTIHPFYDGNGRTARLLMNFLQHYFTLPLAIVFKEDKAAYFEALQSTRKNEDIKIFKTFVYEQYAKYLQQEIDKFRLISSKENKSGGGYSMVF